MKARMSALQAHQSKVQRCSKTSCSSRTSKGGLAGAEMDLRCCRKEMFVSYYPPKARLLLGPRKKRFQNDYLRSCSRKR